MTDGQRLHPSPFILQEKLTFHFHIRHTIVLSTSTFYYQCITVRPSPSIRPFVHLLHFFNILLKDLVALFLHRTDVFFNM